jgi:hypothetical protein
MFETNSSLNPGLQVLRVLSFHGRQSFLNEKVGVVARAYQNKSSLYVFHKHGIFGQDAGLGSIFDIMNSQEVLVYLICYSKTQKEGH